MISKPSLSVLIASGATKGAENLGNLLCKSTYGPVTYVSSGGGARRLMVTNDYDLVIVNTPLTDENGLEFALHCAANDVGVILLVKAADFDSVCYKLEDAGVFTVSKPLYKPLFLQSLKLVEVSSRKLKSAKQENRKLKVKMDEIRLVNRAKWTLIEYLKMNEAQAHRYIEKRAMDTRTSKKEVAESILRTYEVI